MLFKERIPTLGGEDLPPIARMIADQELQNLNRQKIDRLILIRVNQR